MDFIADKIDNARTLSDIWCTNGYLLLKRFFNISSTQRNKISEIIRRQEWDTEVFSKPLFKDLRYVHSYKSTDF